MKVGARRPSLLIVFTAALAALTLSIGAIVVKGVSGRDRLPAKATAGGLDIGGMTPAEARVALLRRFGAQLARPVLVRHGTRTWRLSADESHVHGDVRAMVARALADGRKGNVLVRGVRRLLGLVSPNRQPMRVAYSHAAVVDMTKRVAHRIIHPARSADVDFTRRGL